MWPPQWRGGYWRRSVAFPGVGFTPTVDGIWPPHPSNASLHSGDLKPKDSIDPFIHWTLKFEKIWITSFASAGLKVQSSGQTQGRNVQWSQICHLTPGCPWGKPVDPHGLGLLGGESSSGKVLAGAWWPESPPDVSPDLCLPLSPVSPATPLEDTGHVHWRFLTYWDSGSRSLFLLGEDLTCCPADSAPSHGDEQRTKKRRKMG